MHACVHTNIHSNQNAVTFTEIETSTEKESERDMKLMCTFVGCNSNDIAFDPSIMLKDIEMKVLEFTSVIYTVSEQMP